MGPDLDFKANFETAKEVSIRKDIRGVLKDQEDMLMTCASNCEDNTFDIEASLIEQNTAAHRNEDIDVNVTDCKNSGNMGPGEDEYRDTTESSSSFGDTASENENGSRLSDGEVESCYYGDIDMTAYGGYGEGIQSRQKKLTPHWQGFVRPLMWRCKWLELKMKQLQSQALTYDKELAECQRNQIELDKSTVEYLGAKSLPCGGQIKKNKVMKRRKRKKVEETIDLASYALNHNVFSHYVGKSKKPVAYGAPLDIDSGNLGIPKDKTKAAFRVDEFGAGDEVPSLKFREGDENSLEMILWNIEMVQSQVRRMITRVDKVVSEHGVIFSSAENLTTLIRCETSAGSPQYPMFPSENGSAKPVSSHVGTSTLPDTTEAVDQPLVAASYATAVDGTLTHRLAMNEELNYTEEVDMKSIEPQQQVAPSQEPNPGPSSSRGPRKPSNMKTRSAMRFPDIPKKKRQHRTRLPGPVRWCSRDPG